MPGGASEEKGPLRVQGICGWKGGLLASSGGSRVGDLGYGLPQGRTPSGFVNAFLVEFN